MPPEYLVKVSSKPAVADAKPVVTERIVRAKNEARAISHVVSDTVTVERATIDDAMRLSKLGVEVENAE